MTSATTQGSKIASVICAIISIGVLAWATSIDLGSILLFPVFAVWLVLPYGVLWLVSHQVRERWQEAVLLVVTLVVGIFGVGALVYGFVTHPDPQSGLLLLIIPVWQLLGVGFAAGIILVAERLRKTG